MHIFKKGYPNLLLKTGEKAAANLIKQEKPISYAFSNKANEDGNDKSENLEAKFNKRHNFDVSKITIDEESIKSKLLRNPKLPMDHYHIKKPGNVREYDNKNDVFNFNEQILNRKKHLLQVYGLGNGYFSVNEVWYPGSIIVFDRQVFLWDVSTGADIKPHTLDILEVIKPFPNYIIIGTGKEKYPVDESVYKRFRERGMLVDVIPTFEACSTFNVCNEDGHSVAAFLIPANL